MGTKERVTRKEYNRWIKWLKKQGFSGPFSGLTTSHEWVILLWKELKKDPPTILETKPRDRRTIVSNLDKYGRKQVQKIVNTGHWHPDLAPTFATGLD